MSWTIQWNGANVIGERGYKCGFCDKEVGPNTGYFGAEVNGQYPGQQHRIYICSHCKLPTYFSRGLQVPEPRPGEAVMSLPGDVAQLDSEVRNAMGVGAYTPAAMALRTLLAHVAVDLGAKDNLNFVGYVDYLADNGYVVPGAKAGIDKVRILANAAIHDLKMMTKEQTEELLVWAEMVLKNVYEYPARVNGSAAVAVTTP